MVLDNGAAISGLSEASAQSLHLQSRGKAELTGNGESHLKIGLAKRLTFRLGGIELPVETVAIVPYHDLEAREGRNIGGIVGVDLFRRYVVVIDYALRKLLLFEPHGFIHQDGGEVVPLLFSHGVAVFHGSISLPEGEFVPANLALDIGTYSALRLFRPYVEKRKLLHAEQATADSFGFGIGGEFLKNSATSASSRLARFHSRNLKSAFPRQRAEQRSSAILTAQLAAQS